MRVFEFLSYVATILAAAAAVFAFGFGFYSYYHNNRVQDEATATDLVQTYLQQSADHSTWASTVLVNECERYQAKSIERSCRNYVDRHYEGEGKFRPLSQKYASYSLDAGYAYFASQALSTANAIYILVGGERDTLTDHFTAWAYSGLDKSQTAWNNTVKGIIEAHDTYVLWKLFRIQYCHEYDERFIEYVEEYYQEQLNKPHLRLCK